jgi:hypothetical protein
VGELNRSFLTVTCPAAFGAEAISTCFTKGKTSNSRLSLPPQQIEVVRSGIEQLAVGPERLQFIEITPVLFDNSIYSISCCIAKVH